MLAGSIFDLTPDTDYEAQFTLSDPDGGKAAKTVTFHTRKEPMPAAGGNVYHVYPVGLEGPEAGALLHRPDGGLLPWAARITIMRMPIRCGCSPATPSWCMPALYIGDRYHYLTTDPKPGNLSLGNYFDGTYYLTASGTPDKPIVIKARGRRRSDLRRRRRADPLQPDGAAITIISRASPSATPMSSSCWASRTSSAPAASP